MKLSNLLYWIAMSLLGASLLIMVIDFIARNYKNILLFFNETPLWQMATIIGLVLALILLIVSLVIERTEQ